MCFVNVMFNITFPTIQTPSLCNNRYTKEMNIIDLPTIPSQKQDAAHSLEPNTHNVQQNYQARQQ